MALPSEAESEYATRGGLTGSVFARGDDERPGGELMANYWREEFPWRNTGAKGWRGTSPVGLFPPNGYGLDGMTRNVWEWTSDYYSPRGAGSDVRRNACCTPPTNPRIKTPEPAMTLAVPARTSPAA
jgi:formylglycine-generating enzyme